MKKYILIVIIVQFFSCYTKYGVVLAKGESRYIPSKAHINYEISKYRKAVPQSIIFIISDGTGIGQYTLSYYANGSFAPARFDHVGLVATHPNSGQCSSACNRVTDSAASGTALSSGLKTYNGAIGVDQDTLAIKTMLEIAEEKNMATGLVATSTITHATPASFAAHVDYRKKEREIAMQYARQEIDVILGGGKRFWSDSLIAEYEKRGAQFINTINTPLEENKRILGLFADGALARANEGRTPTTTEMAKLAINKLENNPNGFFIMIEETQVDWGGHANNADYIQGEMASLNELINYVLDYQNDHPDVLVVLTADHECGGVAVHDGSNENLDIQFTSDYHSANFVPIWATGPGAEVFDSFMDNTEIGKQLISFITDK
jgi:alkaline phosphatase